MTGNSLINLDGLSKPATALIEKIGDAVGGVFKPYQIVRVAKAEAEASLISAESQIQVSELNVRAMHRFVEEESKKQANMEAITAGALSLLQDNSKPQNIDNDWIANFFDKSKIVSDTDMQKFWARILAQEANGPGAFARKTVNLLADLDREDAELFVGLCRCCWAFAKEEVDSDKSVPIVFDVDAEIYKSNGVHFHSMTHLESFGLIRFEQMSGFARLNLPRSTALSYFGKQVNLTFPSEQGNSLAIGKVLWTRAGAQLSAICDSSPIEGLFEYTVQRWTSSGLIQQQA